MQKDIEQVKAAKTLADACALALENKKGVSVTVLPVGSKTVVADFFVLATGTSNTHVKALADEVEFEIETNLSIKPTREEGVNNNIWTLIDYGSVVVHIFTKEGREFYKLDKLWSE